VTASEFMAKTDKRLYYGLMASKAEVAIVSIEKRSAEHELEPLMEELKLLSVTSEKRTLLKEENTRLEEIKAKIRTLNVSDDVKKTVAKLKPPVYRTGIFKVPPGEMVELTTKGHPLKVKTGNQIIIKILQGPKGGQLLFVNSNLDPVKIIKERMVLRVFQSDGGNEDVVRLKNIDKNRIIFVHAKII
jgi:hypothetical protein